MFDSKDFSIILRLLRLLYKLFISGFVVFQKSNRLFLNKNLTGSKIKEYFTKLK
jgi:hypothetical protein